MSITLFLDLRRALNIHSGKRTFHFQFFLFQQRKTVSLLINKLKKQMQDLVIYAIDLSLEVSHVFHAALDQISGFL